MSTPKRHHYIPKMLLKRFANNNGKLHFYDKRIKHKGVLCANPDDLFVEKHFYTQYDKSGRGDVTVEKQFSVLESDADRIIEKIITTARSGNTPKLSTNEKETWNNFFLYQWKRTPDSVMRNITTISFDEDVTRAVNEFEKNFRPLTETERADIKTPASRKRIKQNALVMALAKPMHQSLNILRGKGLGIAIIHKSHKSFVIGSLPIVRFASHGRSHLSDPTVELWLPIAPDIAVSPTGGPSGDEKLVSISEDRDIRAINEALFKQSTLIAGRSELLIRSLAGIKQYKS